MTEPYLTICDQLESLYNDLDAHSCVKNGEAQELLMELDQLLLSIPLGDHPEVLLRVVQVVVQGRLRGFLTFDLLRCVIRCQHGKQEEILATILHSILPFLLLTTGLGASKDGVLIQGETVDLICDMYEASSATDNAGLLQGMCQPGALHRYTVYGTGSVFVCVFDLARIDTCFSYMVALISKLVDYYRCIP